MTDSVDLSSVPRSVTQSTVLYFTFRTTTLAALPADRSSRKENSPSGPSAVANGACLANFFFSLQRYGGTGVRRYVPSTSPPHTHCKQPWNKRVLPRMQGSPCASLFLSSVSILWRPIPQRHTPLALSLTTHTHTTSTTIQTQNHGLNLDHNKCHIVCDLLRHLLSCADLFVSLYKLGSPACATLLLNVIEDPTKVVCASSAPTDSPVGHTTAAS